MLAATKAMLTMSYYKLGMRGVYNLYTYMWRSVAGLKTHQLVAPLQNPCMIKISKNSLKIET